MNPRLRSRMPASIGANQASPANSPVPPAAVVLSCSMAWSPPALERRSGSLRQAGDYATTRFHHLRDGTAAGAGALTGSPRKTLGGRSPAEALDAVLRSGQAGVATTD